MSSIVNTVSSIWGSSVLQQAVKMPALSAADALCSPVFAACLQNMQEQNRLHKVHEENAKATRLRGRTQCHLPNSTASASASASASADDSGGESCEDVLAQISAAKGAADADCQVSAQALLNCPFTQGSLPADTALAAGHSCAPGSVISLWPGLTDSTGPGLNAADAGAGNEPDLMCLKLLSALSSRAAAAGPEQNMLSPLQTTQNSLTPYLLYCLIVLYKYRRPQQRSSKACTSKRQKPRDYVKEKRKESDFCWF